MALDLAGSASLRSDATGKLMFSASSAGVPLTLHTKLTISDGGEIQIDDASVDEVAFTPGTNDLDIRGLKGGLRALIAAPIHGHEDAPPVVDIRSAQVLSGGVHLGADGLKTLGTLNIRNFDASIRGLDNFGNEDTDLGIEQLDLSGGAQLKIDGPESISLLEALATLSPQF